LHIFSFEKFLNSNKIESNLLLKSQRKLQANVNMSAELKRRFKLDEASRKMGKMEMMQHPVARQLYPEPLVTAPLSIHEWNAILTLRDMKTH
jgi:hypothetical protein